MNNITTKITKADIDNLVVDMNISKLELLPLLIKIALDSIFLPGNKIITKTDEIIQENLIYNFNLLKKILTLSYNEKEESDKKVQEHIHNCKKLIEKIITTREHTSIQLETAKKIMKEYSDKDDEQNFEETKLEFINFLTESGCEIGKAQSFAELEINKDKLTQTKGGYLRAIFISENNEIDMVETYTGYRLSNTEKIKLFMSDLKIAKEKHGFEMNTISLTPHKIEYILLKCSNIREDLLENATPDCIRLGIRLSGERLPYNAIQKTEPIKTLYNLLIDIEKRKALKIGGILRGWINTANGPMMTRIVGFLKDYNKYYDMKNRRKTLTHLQQFISERTSNLEEFNTVIDNITENKISGTLTINLDLDGEQEEIKIEFDFNDGTTLTEKLEKIISSIQEKEVDKGISTITSFRFESKANIDKKNEEEKKQEEELRKKRYSLKKDKEELKKMKEQQKQEGIKNTHVIIKEATRQKREEKIKQLIIKITNEQKELFEKLINLLPEKNLITLSHQTLVHDARIVIITAEEYARDNELSKPEFDTEKLIIAEDRISVLAEIQSLIDSLPLHTLITLENFESYERQVKNTRRKVEQTKTDYQIDNLDFDLTKLEATERRITYFITQTRINNVQILIDSLPSVEDISLEHKEQIILVRKEISRLIDSGIPARKLELDKFDAIEVRLAKLRKPEIEPIEEPYTEQGVATPCLKVEEPKVPLDTDTFLYTIDSLVSKIDINSFLDLIKDTFNGKKIEDSFSSDKDSALISEFRTIIPNILEFENLHSLFKSIFNRSQNKFLIFLTRSKINKEIKKQIEDTVFEALHKLSQEEFIGKDIAIKIIYNTGKYNKVNMPKGTNNFSFIEIIYDIFLQLQSGDVDVLEFISGFEITFTKPEEFEELANQSPHS